MPCVIFGSIHFFAATVNAARRTSVIAEVLVLLLVCGCYHMPDYSTADLKCDVDHPDCPPGQACVDGHCNPGGIPPVSVICGDVICGADQVCCADVQGNVTCIAPGVECEGAAASCDGVEDCAGTACCLTPVGAKIACGEANCSEQICREDRDCLLSSAPICCQNVGLPNEPWGHCFSTCP